MAYTTAATGNKSAGATWVGGVKPPDNEDWIVAAGHTLTVDEDSICGQSPAEGGATRAISYGSATSKVIVAEDVFLRIRGDYGGKGSTTAAEQFTMEQGAIVEIDASQATDPMNQNYRFIFGDNNTQRSIIKINGTVAKPCTFRSNASGGNGYFTRAGFGNLGYIDATYCNFERIGDGTNPAFNGGLAATSLAIYRTRNCIFDACGLFPDMTGTPHADATLDVQDCLWKNTAHATRCVQFGPAPATAGGNFKNCDPDKEVQFTGCAGWTLDGTHFYGGQSVAGSTAWTSAQDVIFRHTGGVSSVVQVCGDVTRGYFLKDVTGTNPHGLSPRGDIPSILDGVIIDYIGTSNVGDLINLQAATVSRAVTVRRCILLKNASGGQIGKLISILGANNVVIAEHNTICVDGASNAECGVVEYGETYNGVDGMVTSVKSNLAIGLVSGGGVVLARYTTSSVQFTDATDFDYNGIYQPKAGSDGDGYHAFGGTPSTIFSSGSPGANDVTVSADPCVNSNANMATWDTSLGGAGTRANALAELRKRNERSGYNTAYSFAALHAYMRAQFAVTDATLIDAGHDGVTIGASYGITTVTPALGVLTAAGFAPTVSVGSSGTTASPGVGVGVLAGLAPTVSVSNNQTVTAGVGVLAAAGLAPTVSTTGHVTVDAGVGVAVLTGFDPVISVGDAQVAQPLTGVLVADGLAPVVSTTAHVTVDSGTGVAVLTGQAPTVSATAHVTASTDVGAALLDGFEPTITVANNQVAQTDVGVAVLTGSAPTVSVTGHVTVTPGAGTAVLTGYAPLVTGTPPVVVPSTGSGGTRPRRGRRSSTELGEFVPDLTPDRAIDVDVPVPAFATLWLDFNPQRVLVSTGATIEAKAFEPTRIAYATADATRSYGAKNMSDAEIITLLLSDL